MQEKLAPNVLAMVRAFNTLAQLVTTEVLAEESQQSRAEVIATHIKVSRFSCNCFYNTLQPLN